MIETPPRKAWDKIDVKVSTIHNVLWNQGASLPPVYMITSEGKYIATVQDPRFVDMILGDIRDRNPGVEIRVNRS